jgi:hypothetical protein
MMRSLYLLLVLLLIPLTVSAIGLRIGDIGQGHVPEFIGVGDYAGFEIGFGISPLAKAGTSSPGEVGLCPPEEKEVYVFVADITLFQHITEQAGGFVRFGTNFENRPTLKPAIGVFWFPTAAKVFSVEAQYGWQLSKLPDALEFMESGDSRFVLNIAAYFNVGDD